MLILHASYRDGGLLLWGERPVLDDNENPPRRGRKRKTASPPSGIVAERSPYDAGEAALRDALAMGGVLDDASVADVPLWLPSVGALPVASSPLIAAPPNSDSEIALRPWITTASPLSIGQAMTLLGSCAGRDALRPGTILGASMHYWTTAMRFAGALVARQMLLPGAERDAGGWRARWEPVFIGPDVERRAALANAMPAVCRALASDAESPPDAPADLTLAAFIADVCDHLVRSGAVADAPVPPKRRARSKTPAFDSLHDQWLHALRSSDSRMTGEPEELADFAAQIREWRRPLTLSVAAPFRLCFRLEEPEIDEEEEAGEASSVRSDDGWHVRYLLQSAKDPSLLIPANEAWRARGSSAKLFRQEGFEPREYLLSSLGQASKISSNVESSLKAAAPGGYDLDAAGAYEFLTEQAGLLEQAGFGAMLPAWWTRKGGKRRLAARASVKSPRMQSRAGLSLDSIVEVDWEAALGEEKLTLQELEELARRKASLVRFRGQWVELNAREIEEALAYWRKHGDDQVRLRDVMRMSLGAGTAMGSLPLEAVEATGWVGEFLERMDGGASLEETPPPDAFRGTLRPYQSRGYSWLSFLGRWGLGACLADDMGLGKTPQTLAFIRHRWDDGERRPALVICPTSVVDNWRKEAARFTPDLPVMIHHGAGRLRDDRFKEEAERSGLVLSSYALLHRDYEMLNEIAWGGVVLDEAQNIKNPETKQSKAARALKADWRIALTGTPVENHVGDLWAVMEFLNPGFLGSQAEFRRAFFLPIQVSRDPEAAERLKKITGPFILRRLKTDRSIIADLPEKIEMKTYCALTKEQASLYQAVVKEATESLDDSEGIQRKGLVLATLSKLKQVCNHPAQFLGDRSSIPDRSGKLTRLTEMLEEALDAGDKALIFTQFAEMGEILRAHLQERFGRETLFLHGGVSKKERDRMVERFEREGAALPLSVLSIKAGGVGLNLTAANHVFHYDRWWNPAVENQATDRAFRIGQKKNVQVRKFVCSGTLEEKIDEMIESKRAIAADVVGTGEGWLTELSTAELKELFALSREAGEE